MLEIGKYAMVTLTYDLRVDDENGEVVEQVTETILLEFLLCQLMYKHRVSVTRVWSKFMLMAVNYMSSFFVYGLFVFVLGIAVAIAVILFAVMTCCIGFLLIMIPFVGAVILLPVSYTFRAFSIEYLAMFGNQFNLFEKKIDDSGDGITF